MIGLVVALLVLPESKDSTGHHRFDVPGVLLLAVAMVAIVYPVVSSESWGWTSPKTLGLLAVGLILLGLFALLESRTEHPLLPMRLFRNASLSVGTAITAVNFFVLLGSIFYVMLYLQNVRGYSPVEAGVLTLPLSLTSMVASPLGTAVLISVLGARAGSAFSRELLDAGVPADLAEGLRSAEGAVAVGIAPVVEGMPAEVQDAVARASAEAFVSGAHTAAVVTGVLCLLGALLSWTVVRRGANAVDLPAMH